MISSQNSLLVLAVGAALSFSRKPEKDEPQADDAPRDDDASPESRTGEG